VVTVLLWGSAFVAIRVALRDFSAVQLSVLRLGVAALALSMAAAFFAVRRLERGDVPRFLFVGLTGMAAYQLLLNAGEVTVPAGTASLLVATAPVFSALMARWALAERLNLLGWSGIVISLAGAVVVTLGTGNDVAIRGGALLVLGAAVAQATFFVLQKPLLVRYSPFEVTFYAMWIGAIVLLPLGRGLPGAIADAHAGAALAVAVLGVGASAIGFVTWAYALRHVDLSIAASTLYLAPVVALVVGWVVLSETPAVVSLVGGLLALAGVALATTKGKVATPARPGSGRRAR